MKGKVNRVKDREEEEERDVNEGESQVMGEVDEVD